MHAKYSLLYERKQSLLSSTPLRVFILLYAFSTSFVAFLFPLRHFYTLLCYTFTAAFSVLCFYCFSISFTGFLRRVTLATRLLLFYTFIALLKCFTALVYLLLPVFSSGCRCTHFSQLLMNVLILLVLLFYTFNCYSTLFTPFYTLHCSTKT